MWFDYIKRDKGNFHLFRFHSHLSFAEKYAICLAILC
jgi:hypothetical protein